MERTKTVTVTITVDPTEEMFSVETIEGESGCTTSSDRLRGGHRGKTHCGHILVTRSCHG